MTGRRALFAAVAAILAGVIAWTAGFLWFLHIASKPVALPPHADAIVALTGGAWRVETALHLLAEGRADQLLVSGIGGGAELRDLATRAGLDPIPFASRVTLGRSATSTRGNALETVAWVRARSVHSIIVVTAFYHMPRALLELHRAMPAVTLYPMPVLSFDPPGPIGGRPAVPMRLLAEEYTKYLLVLCGVSQWLPPLHEPSTARGHVS